MKFIVDVMLGRLAKWLRILGYDTLYDSSYTDERLFFIAHLEKRILLTRDTALANRISPAYCHFIHSQAVQEQVRDIVTTYQLDWQSHLFTRCTLCNTLTEPIPREHVRSRVPDFVWETTTQFVYCPTCDKIYWPGSHIKQVRVALAKLAQ
ncbi:Mut7-C RNAse domain-containing protein [candidate division KSB1 bacterium]|nr:Mut7-C RNAse domain-containing protein [candidate division KSB1 bacterium]